MGAKIRPRPANVTPGSWATEILIYRHNVVTNGVSMSTAMVYNYDQVENPVENYKSKPILFPNYTFVEKILNSTGAQIEYNDKGEAWYFYPPHDYITLPRKHYFEQGIGGLPGYYEGLAHELMHWTEARLSFDIGCDEAIRELRAEIGSSLLMEELNCPHSVSFSNIDKWRDDWIELLSNDDNLIFRIAASACRAVDYLMAFGTNVEDRFNVVNEEAA
jgi:antirestriction protein ArdC